METADSSRKALEESIRSLELENRQYGPRFFASQEGNTKGGSSRWIKEILPQVDLES